MFCRLEAELVVPVERCGAGSECAVPEGETGVGEDVGLGEGERVEIRGNGVVGGVLEVWVGG